MEAKSRGLLWMLELYLSKTVDPGKGKGQNTTFSVPNMPKAKTDTFFCGAFCPFSSLPPFQYAPPPR
jgi:hypothetical protein